jgi:hypothetical protein
MIVKTPYEKMLYDRYIRYIRYDMPITQFVIDSFKKDLQSLKNQQK